VPKAPESKDACIIDRAPELVLSGCVATFREWNVEQAWLFPPSVLDLVPEGHVAHFVRDTIRSLDLTEILKPYQTEDRGFPAYHPTMMTALLLYAYCNGIFSSRRIARACEERVDFMAVTGMQKPDFRTVSDFRKRHLPALSALFVQVLKLCQRAGMVRLGHVALDGTKIKANASKRKAMSYGRMKEKEPELAREVAQWMKAAESTDKAEDKLHGREKRGDEMPQWIANKQQRLEKIREAMAALEAEAKGSPDNDPPPKGGGSPPPEKSAPAPSDKAQRNFTDPDSRILKTSDGFVQGYNCQLAVDAGEQVIVAHDTTNQQNDGVRLPSMLKAIKRNTGRQAKELSADSNYCTLTNLAETQLRRIRAYIAIGRQKHGAKAAVTGRLGTRKGNPIAVMRARLLRGGHRSRYRLRKQVVEPVIGQIKEALGFQRFLLRRQSNVRHELGLVCTAHNLRKLARRAARPAAA